MKYQCGDFVGTQTIGASRITSWALRKFFTPDTEGLFHFFVIRGEIPDEDDYEIKESIGSGVRDGRFSWYKDRQPRVFRLPDPVACANAEMACCKYSRYGRAGYDYLLCVKLFMGAVRCWCSQLIHEHHIRKIHPAELPYARDSEFICTELAYEISYLMGAPILPPTVVSIPPSIMGAVKAGKLVEVT